MVVGGRQSFLNRLSLELPKWKIFNADVPPPDSILSNADIVDMFTDHMSHVSYMPVIKQLRNCRSNLLYLHNVNMQYVIGKIYEICMDKG